MMMSAWNGSGIRGQLILSSQQKHVPVQVSLKALPLTGVPSLSVIVTDITDRKDAEALLVEKNNELSKSNADLESFAYIASHDLQEPLRMVASYSMLLLKRIDHNDKDSVEFGEFILEGVQRMQQMLKDLLAYSRVGRSDVRFEMVNTQELVDHVKRTLEERIKETGAILICNEMPEVYAVRSLLGQVFQNLIENALKFQRQGVIPKVEVTAKKKGKEWVFSVKDNGIGIDEKYRDRVFLLFQRLHTRDEYEGSGIGLSITKKIIEFLGGRIWIESRPGEYSIFHFTLPVQHK
jgi:light-regulated signal transduction histidine kinase (bacteriophytochrome)